MVRTLGGCLALIRAQTTAYQRRVAERFDLKQAIGREAAREVQPGDQVLINDGSTTFHLASCLGSRGPITVYTNSVAMIAELGRFEAVRLFLLGGEYQRELNCLGGALLAGALDAIRADVAFLGADAVAADGRCLALTPDAARDARRLLGASRRAILLADATKTAERAGAVFGGLRDFDLWITTADIPRALFQRLSRQTRIREVKP